MSTLNRNPGWSWVWFWFKIKSEREVSEVRRMFRMFDDVVERSESWDTSALEPLNTRFGLISVERIPKWP